MHALRACIFLVLNFFLRDSFCAIVDGGAGTVPRRKGFYQGARAEFLAILPELRQALLNGQAVKAFYVENKNRFGFSYSQLNRLLRTFGVRAEIDAALAASAAASQLDFNERLAPVPALPPRQAVPVPIQASPAIKRHPLSTAPPRDCVQPPPSGQSPDFHYDPADAYKTKFD